MSGRNRKGTQPQPQTPPKLSVSREEARRAIRAQVEKGKAFLATEISDEQAMGEFVATLKAWRAYNNDLLEHLFDTDRIATEYSFRRPSAGSVQITTLGRPAPPLPPVKERAAKVRECYQEDIKRLESIAGRLDIYWESGTGAPLQSGASLDPLDGVYRIADRFHTLARQLRRRQRQRQGFEINDEYDVQDLLHALLRLYYDDIRTEEWTPSYAGSSTRMDFLLKREQAVIEAKKTRAGLGDREVGQQLIQDVAHYREHPDCKTLICFVYDPDGMIQNPSGIEADIARQSGSMAVKVIVRPL